MPNPSDELLILARGKSVQSWRLAEIKRDDYAPNMPGTKQWEFDRKDWLAKRLTGCMAVSEWACCVVRGARVLYVVCCACCVVCVCVRARRACACVLFRSSLLLARAACGGVAVPALLPLSRRERERRFFLFWRMAGVLARCTRPKYHHSLLGTCSARQLPRPCCLPNNNNNPRRALSLDHAPTQMPHQKAHAPLPRTRL